MCSKSRSRFTSLKSVKGFVLGSARTLIELLNDSVDMKGTVSSYSQQM